MHQQKITHCLWFDTQTEEAAQFYCAIFPNSLIKSISRYGEAGHEIHGKPAERVMAALLKMKKLDIAALKQAYEGESRRQPPHRQFAEPFINFAQGDHHASPSLFTLRRQLRRSA